MLCKRLCKGDEIPISRKFYNSIRRVLESDGFHDKVGFLYRDNIIVRVSVVRFEEQIREIKTVREKIGLHGREKASQRLLV